MSGGEVNGSAVQRIQRVQHLIEQCIQSHMTRAEVVNYLQSEVAPDVVELVWQKLEEENQDFFEAYNLRLALKQQIVIFNELLEKQAQLMHQVLAPGALRSPMPNGSHMTQFPQNSGCYAADISTPSLKPGSLDQTLSSRLAHSYSNGVSPQDGNVHAALRLSGPSGILDSLPNTLLSQCSNVRLMQGMNGGVVKSEGAYESSSPYIFAADGNVMEARETIDDASLASFGGMESSSQALDDPLFDVNASSYLLPSLPRSFNFSSLPPAYSENMVEGYSGSPYLATETGNIFGSHHGGIQLHEDSKTALETLSGGFSYDVGSE